MKILLSAFSFEPNGVSEPGIAWRILKNALSEKHEVWVTIERSRYENLTRKYLAQNPLPGFHPVFFDPPVPLAEVLRKSGTLTVAIYYHLWQHRLLKVARQLHEQVGFDLTHHITFGRYWSPCGVRALGIPFIWGPVGAAESAPASFRAELPLRERIFEQVRDRGRLLCHKSRALRETARATTIGIGVTAESCAALRSLGVAKVNQLPQVALTDEELAFFGRVPPPPDGPFRAICIGRLLHWKGFHLAIRAFALFARKDPQAELWIVNDGPFRRELEKTAAATGMQSRIRFLGHLASYAAVVEKLAQSHVLMHPALHEAFGNVCLEALAAGRPVVCLDAGGPASQVTPETGFAAPINTPEEAIEAMASYLTKIAANRALLLDASARARVRAQDKFGMRTVGQTISNFYREAVQLHSDVRSSRSSIAGSN